MTDTAKNQLELWAEEHHQDILQLRYRIRRTLFSEESEFQRIDIVETAGYGRMLFNDSIAMISERDEFIYHEMIAHPAMFVHPGVRRALVIGGGDGGTVRELLRHPTVEHVRLVEIDPMVLRGCREHIPQTAAALDDPRVEVTVGDGVAFVAETEERYDLVIVDSTDPIGPATPLFGKTFYANVANVLNDDGIVVSQAESCFYELDRQRSMMEILSTTFGRARIYNYVNLTYPGGLWSFTFASRAALCPLGDLSPSRIADSGLEFRYYSPEIHRAAFVLPQFQNDALQRWIGPD
ncbi:MAG: polyamine aminopropyltransferase [Acidobacteriota bacterium]|nr:polyamine aminopropyltransferase [Acidobacteriota bacterium]